MTPAQLQAFELLRGIAPQYSFETRPDDWAFRDFLLNFAHEYHQDISSYSSDDGLTALVTELEMTIVPLYDHPHDSDESSSVEFLLVKGVPLVGWKRVGDKNDYSDGLEILNDAAGRELALRVWSIVQKEEEKTVGRDDLDVLDWVFSNNHYVHRIRDLREDPIAYVIDSPHWMLGRMDPSTNKLYTINEDNTLSPIARIVSVERSKNSWDKDSYHTSVVELTDGTTRTVNSGHILHMPIRAR